MSNQGVSPHTALRYTTRGPKRADQLGLSRLMADQRFHLLLILIISAPLLFARLEEGSLGGYDDAFYAFKGRRMRQTGQWWIVENTEGFWEYAQPLFIWLEALAFALLGPTDFAAKFFPALAGWLTIMLVYGLAHQLSQEEPDRSVARWWPVVAGMVLMGTQYFIKYAMHAMTDVPFTCLITAALLFYFKGIRRPPYWLLFGLLSGLALLTRSAVGLLPLAIAAAHLLWTRRWRCLFSPYFLIATGLALAMAVSWFIPNYRAHGQPFWQGQWGLILNQIGTDSAETVWGYFKYGKHLTKYYWPWLPCLVVGLILHGRKAVKERHEGARFLLLWVIAVMVPFTLAHAKVLRYILPAFPAFSLLAAYPLVLWLSEGRKIKLMQWLSLGLSVGIVIYTWLPTRMHLDRSPDMRSLARLAQPLTAPEESVILYCGGRARWNRRHELIWYADRPVHLVTDYEQLSNHWHTAPGLVFIIDKPSFDRLRAQTETMGRIAGQSERYVCAMNDP